MNRLHTGLPKIFQTFIWSIQNISVPNIRLPKTFCSPVKVFADQLVTFLLPRIRGEGGAHLVFVIFAHFQLRRIPL
nr:MAG TPA: hypothetical protein [Caudoviricetes sp.]